MENSGNNFMLKRIQKIKEKQSTFSYKLYLVMKRIIDILAGIIGIIIMLILAVIIKIVYVLSGDFKSILYVQKRIGKDGKPINMYKFRSMVYNADEILNKVLEDEEKRKEWELYQKLEHDPRITKIGKFLRKTSLDEWPQFLSILTGKMSLVGPRPYLLSEKEEMGEYYKYIIKSKPGLTGLWQVSGRSNLTFEDRLKLDEEYSNRQGNIRDFKILIKTFHKVFGEEGAI